MPLQIIRQDITKIKVDAIVNTTNEEMIGYGGIDLAVHTIAGERLDAECQKLAPLGLGEAKISGAYNLPCKYIIHTSGPIWQGGLLGESVLLRSCYVESLKLAVEHKCKTVAFPLISAGTYGYPKDQVLKFAVQTITEFLMKHELTVYLCVFDKEAYTFSQKLFDDIKAYIDDEYIDNHNSDRGNFFKRHYKECHADCYEDYSDKELLDCSISEYPMSAPVLENRSVSYQGKSLAEYLEDRDMSFQEMLFELIDRSGMTDVACYKKANVDKRTFSKIKSNKDYKPSKQTAIAFAISLQLDLEETQALLATVGFTLSKSSTFDKIIRFFIQTRNYNIFEINEALFEFDQMSLGSVG